MLVADLTVFDASSGDEVAQFNHRSTWYPPRRSIGTPSIRAGTPFNGLVDLYASLVTVDGGEQAAFRFFVNPGIGLLWLGGAVMALGGVVAAWPTHARTTRTPVPSLSDTREEVRV